MIEIDIMIFLELTELIFEKLQNFQALRKSPVEDELIHDQFVQLSVFPFLQTPLMILKAKKAGHFLEGGIMVREGLQQQMPHI